MTNGSWRADETYIKVKGLWTYLYRAVDRRGWTIDFLLSARRDAAAARRFFRKPLKQQHVRPRTITVDKNPAYPSASRSMKKAGELSRFARLRRLKYLNNIVEQDHRPRSSGWFGRASASSRCARPAAQLPATRSLR